MSERRERDDDMTRERARTERRDVDLERGEPLAGGAARGGSSILGMAILTSVDCTSSSTSPRDRVSPACS